MTRHAFFTTFEISQICGVNPTTVQNWVKGKKLKAFQTPGGHRRVRREDLISFMKEFSIPIPPSLSGDAPLVLIVDDESDILDMMEELMKSGNDEIRVAKARNGVDALLMIGETKPDLLILDIMMPGMNGLEVCRKLNRVPHPDDQDSCCKRRSIPPKRKRPACRGRSFTKPLELVPFENSVSIFAPMKEGL